MAQDGSHFLLYIWRLGYSLLYAEEPCQFSCDHRNVYEYTSSHSVHYRRHWQIEHHLRGGFKVYKWSPGEDSRLAIYIRIWDLKTGRHMETWLPFPKKLFSDWSNKSKYPKLHNFYNFQLRDDHLGHGHQRQTSTIVNCGPIFYHTAG